MVTNLANEWLVNLFDHLISLGEAKMETLSYSLMAVGFVLVLGGIVAVINFDQPSEVFLSVWWMIVSGWCLALVGIGIEIMHLFKLAKREAS